jgi:hypothetical protein
MADGKDLSPAPPAPAPAPAKSKQLPETTEAYPWPSNHEIKKESNPFTDRDWRMLVYAWSGLFVRIIIVFGALFTVYQFLAAREEKRVERSLELVTLWESEAYQDAQRALRQRLSALNTRNAALFQGKLTETQRGVILGRIGEEALSEDGGTMPLADFQEEFDRIVYFLNRLSFCIEGDLCSRAVLDAYFRDYGVSFWSYFSAHIQKQRRAGLPNYAKPLETYVLSVKSVEPTPPASGQPAVPTSR